MVKITLFTKVDMKRSVLTLARAHCLLRRLYVQPSFLKDVWIRAGKFSTENTFFKDFTINLTYLRGP